MWSKTTSDPFEDGFNNMDSYKTGSSGWSPGVCEASWPLPPSAWPLPSPSNGNRGRRHSAASDSGDTGFGTSCSDSVEDQSSSSTGPPSSHRPGGAGGSPGGPCCSMRLSGGSPGVPTAHIMPCPSLSSSTSSSGLANSNNNNRLGGAVVGHAPFWGGSCQLLPNQPSVSQATPTLSPLDMRDPRPVRRWSSLTRLSGGGAEKPSSRAAPVSRFSGSGGGGGGGGPLYGFSLSSQNQHHGSLDRGLLYGYHGRGHAPDSSSGSSPSLLLGYDPPLRHRYEHRTSGGASTGADSSPLSSAVSSPLKPSSLDLNYGALPESRLVPGVPGGVPGTPSAVGGSPIQTAVRTQMWLSEQMEQYRPPPPGGGGALEQGAWPSHDTPTQHRDRLQQQRHHQEAELNQMLSGTSLPVNTLVKIKEGLLRQRELEIDRQKQQILQLHARIRENELRAQQVLHGQRGRCDDSYLLNAKDSSPYDGPCGGVAPSSTTTAPGSPAPPSSERGPAPSSERGPAPSSERGPAPSPCCERRSGGGGGGGELARKLAAAEQEALTLSDFLRHNAQKHAEDLKKMEEKMKTRDRYIVSLKKKCQRESEQNAEKQQRIETLERYLGELPLLEDTHTQREQLSTSQQRCADLESQICVLELSASETQNLSAQKDLLIGSQSAREEELVATVHSLQQKIEQCLLDGVRLPVMDLKHLEEENTLLLETRTHHSKVIDRQKKQIDRLSQELTATERRLQLQNDVTQQLQDTQNHRQGEMAPPAAESGSLLREMSLCLTDLQALCSVLVQRARGQTPNISLLLGIQSMGVSGEEGVDNAALLGLSEGGGGDDGSLRDKLLQVGQLRRDIDELRRSMSDRYAQDMGDSCITQ